MHRVQSRFDKETLGARCFEIIRDAAGRVVGFDHVETCSIKPTSKDKEYTVTTIVDPTTGATKQVERQFRRFLQVLDTGRKVWFKEFGDPRKINPETGEVDNSLSIEDEATELYYDAIYSPGTPVGVPRWAGAIPALLGSREAEMVNLNFFRDNAIPALAVLVSGGALTEESFEKIDQYITGVRGAASMNRIVVMEAVSDGAEAAAIDGSLPAPKIDIKPMLSERQHEGLFQDYIKEAERKIREHFRLPPVYVGSAEEYNRASAFASILTAEQQVFVPERKEWDYMFDRVVLSTHSLRYWRVRSAGPGMQDPAEVARIVNSLGREGALTPNIAVKLANRYLDADIPVITDDWGNIPFSIIMSYVDQGDTITGLDIFEERVNEAVNADGTPFEEVEDDATKPVTSSSKSLRRLLNKVYAKMQAQLDDAIQSIVADNPNAN
jgi:capsid portal protein